MVCQVVLELGEGVPIKTANESSLPGWLLVYKGTEIITIFEKFEGQVTTTIHNMEQFQSEKALLERVKNLGLNLEKWLANQAELEE